ATMANRIGRELKQLSQDPPPGVAAWLVDDSDTSKLKAQLDGPEDTPYFGGLFRLSLTLPSQYPFRPPEARFLTRIYHPNIDASGRICLDILKMPPQGGWKPSINLSTLLTSLRLLLAEPNGDDPLLVDVAKEYKQDPQLFFSKAKSWTERYADPR
ncbi:ubiquitin-conjugating enzyme/RWD-like protein, partial [Piptocephalis cylindrospora]